jgi:transposase
MQPPQDRSDYHLFVGVDIAARSATAAWQDAQGQLSRPVQIAQSPQGHAALHEKRGATGVPAGETLMVLEATGSYWITLATTFARWGYAVSVINPRQAHDFANSLLKRAKSDAIDAQTLAQLAALLPPERWTPPPAIYAELPQRLAQRDSLLALRQQVTNQLHPASGRLSRRPGGGPDGFGRRGRPGVRPPPFAPARPGHLVAAAETGVKGVPPWSGCAGPPAPERHRRLAPHADLCGQVLDKQYRISWR